MKKVWVLAVAGVGAGLLLFAGSCAPAQAPAPAQPAQQQPAQQQPAAKPAAQQPAASQPAAQQPTKPTKSVSGIPLDPDAKYGGVLIVTDSQLLPLITWEESAGVPTTISHMVSNMLVRFQTWGTLEDFKAQAWTKLHPDLATSWEQSPDGLSWTFKLRDGVKWSDGQPFTCEDAKWSLDTIRTAKGLLRSPRATQFVGVDRIECADALTMVIRMARPKPSLLSVAIRNGTSVIYPKHYYENNLAEMRDKGPKVGSGPFSLKELVPGEKFVFVRRKDYWDQPLPYVDGVEIRIVPTSAVAIGIRGGRIDMGAHGAVQSGAAYKTLEQECKDCTFWPRMISNNIATLIPNHNRPPWNTPEVMDALSLSIDRKKFIQLSADGWGVPPVGGGYYPGSYWAMPLERVKQIPGYNFDTPEENKARARELLAKAGYKPGDLRLNFSIALNANANLPPLLEDLQLGGFNATGKVLDSALSYDLLTSGDFDVMQITTAITGGYDPDAITYEHFYPGSDRNYGRYSSIAFQTLVDKMSATVDPEERRRLAWDAMEIGLRDHGKIILNHGEAATVTGRRVRGQMGVEFLGYAYFGPNQRYDHVWLVD